MKRKLMLAACVLGAMGLGACWQVGHEVPLEPSATQRGTTMSAMPMGQARPMDHAMPMKPAMNEDLMVWVDTLDLTKATQGWKTTNANLSAEGNPVTLKEKTFGHAVGTHAPGMMVIDLKGAAVSFSATVGIDDDAEAEGHGGFVVIGDGKVLADTGAITRDDPVKPIKVNLTGVKQLVLLVNTGDDDNKNNDHTDWAEAMIMLDPAKAKDRPVMVEATEAKLPAGMSGG